MNMKKIVSLILAAIMLLSCLTISVSAASAVSILVQARKDAPAITIDGVVSQTEWGAPIGRWSGPDCWVNYQTDGTYWHGWDYYQMGSTAADQYVELYVRRDTTKAYVAIRLVNASGLDTSLTSMDNLWNAAHAVFTIGTYNAETNVERGQYLDEIFEKYVMYRFGLLNGTTKAHTVSNKGAAASLLNDNNYAIVYDDASKTYTYEIAIPYAGTNGYLNAESDWVMSLDVADMFGGSNSAGASRYIISYAAERIQADSSANKTYHQDTKPLHITFGADYVDDTVRPMPTAKPVLDGTVTEGEWGTPVIQTSPGHAYATWANGYWNNEAYDYDQKAKVYLTNDNDFIYMAVTLDHEKDSVAFTGANHWVFPKIGFAIGAANAAGTDIYQTEYQGNMYDCYNAWDLRFDEQGNPQIVLAGQQGTGDMYYALSKDDVFAKYDPNTDTYTYEVRVPLNLTNILNVHPDGADKMALSLHISAGHFNNSLTAENNRYNIGGLGWASLGGNTPLSGKCLIMNLNPITAEGTYVSNVASSGQEISVDGKISSSEWGSPVAVMSDKSPNFFNDDPRNGTGDQRAKVYLSNDNDYIYVGATLNRAEKGVTFSGTDGWKYPLFQFTLSTWDDATTVKKVGNAEQYNKFMFNLGAAAVCHNYSLNIANGLTLGIDDYKVVYDPDTRTYTYEARIPISETNIDYNVSMDVAFSAQVGTTLFDAAAYNDRYNLGLAAANHPYQDNAHEGGRAVKITLNQPDWTSYGTYVNDTVADKQGDITIDAAVSESEWGKPVIVTTPVHAQGYWSPNGYWKSEPTKTDNEQRLKVYMTNDAQYLYVAATMDKTDATTNLSAATYGMPQMIMTLSKYDAATNVPRVNGKEQFTAYRIGWTTGGEISCSAESFQMPAFALTENDWEVKYDAATRTYTYELRIPLSSTNINVHEISQIAASFQFGDSNHGTNGSENNRYNIGGIPSAYRYQANTDGQFPHAGQPVLVMNLRQDYYMKDDVSGIPASMSMDGKITVSEWGEPIIVSNPSFARQGVCDYWDFDPAAMDDSQTARIWMTNDYDYVYIGATLDKSDYQTATTNAAGAPLQNFMRPHFGVDFSQYDAANTVKRTEYQGDIYEQYTGFIVWMDDAGNEQIAIRTLGLPYVALAPEDYAVSYDAATRTYTYELRVPYSMTNLDLMNNREAAVAFTLGTTYSGVGEQSNRYIFGRGITGSNTPNVFPHKDACLPMTLNDAVVRVTPVVKNQIEVRTGDIFIDGVVSDAEWGEPVILTNPKHTQDTWGSFWEFEKQASDRQQTAKIYMRNDHDGIYVAAVLDRSEYNSATTNAAGAPLYSYMRPHFRFTYGAYDEKNTVQHIMFNDKEWERYGGYEMYLDDNGSVIIKDLRQGMDAMTLDPNNYTIKYDDVNKTYTYEIYIPYEYTDIDIYKGLEMAFSASIGTTYAGIGEQSNRYNITTGQAFCGGSENFSHKNNALKFTLGDARVIVDTYVKDTVSKFSGNVAIDGKISANEWGEPIIVTTPSHCQATWGNYWEFDKSAIVPYQAAKIYATNDDQYVYFAATINETDFCDMEANAYEKAHFYISLGRYDEQSDMERIKSNGRMYERYVHYSLGFDGSTPQVSVDGIKVDRVGVNKDDWAIRYDAQTRTYIYEIRIPYEKTTLRFGNDNKMNVCFTMASAKVSEDKSANRYNIGGTGTAFGSTAPDNFAHTGQSLMFNLNENPYAEEGVWTPPSVANPDNGDLAIFPLIALLAVAALGIVTLTVVRKKVK